MRRSCVSPSVSCVQCPLCCRACLGVAASMGPKRNNPFQDALQPLWEKIWNLEGAIGDLHPEYSQRTVTRMEELADLTKNHANDVLRIANDQKVALGKVVHESKQCHAMLEETTSRCQKSLEEATARHYKEAHELRYELYGLKQFIGQQSTEYCDEREKSLGALKALKDDLEALKVNVEALKVDIEAQRGQYMEIMRAEDAMKAMRENFEWQKGELAERALHTPRDQMDGIMDRAREMAEVRSPRSRSIARAQRERSRSASHASWSSNHTASVQCPESGASAGGHGVMESWSHEGLGGHGGRSRASSRPPYIASTVQEHQLPSPPAGVPLVGVPVTGLPLVQLPTAQLQ